MELRDLLIANSASDSLDESSPLSAPDLHLLKERLHVRSLQIKDKVQTYLKSHYNDFSHIISKASAASAEAEILSQNLDEILRSLDSSLDTELCGLVSRRSALKSELGAKAEALSVLRDVESLISSLENVRKLIERGKLKESAQALQDLSPVLCCRDEDDKDSLPKVLVDLRNERDSCFSKLRDLLHDLFEGAIQVNSSDSTLVIYHLVKSNRLPTDVAELDFCSILTAMDMAGTLDAAFARFSDLVMKYIMTPMINISAIDINVEECDKYSSTLHWPLSNSAQRAILNPETLYPKLVQVLQFLYQHVCYENGKWMSILGRLLWPRLSDSIIANCLSKAVPTEAAEVVKFQKTLQLTKEFESTLKEMAFISSSDDRDMRLSNFSDNIEVHFATKKRNQVIARARQLLVSSDFSKSLDGSDLLFQSISVLTSDAAKKLVEMVHAVLQDATSSTMRVAIEFYHAARDSLLLYKAIVPVKLAKELSDLTPSAIIVINDCQYISQEALGLAFEYKSSLPDELKEFAMFADLAPLFNQLANDILINQIELVISRLNETLDQANGFQNTHKKQQLEMANITVDQVVLLLEKVRMIWKPSLQQAVYNKVMCVFLQHIFNRLGSEILMLDDMAIEETLQLQSLIQRTLESLAPLLVSVTGEDIELIDNGIPDFSWDKIEQLIPSLRKLRRIADLLDMPLKSITLSWENGELIASGFSAPEVEKLIKAIFSDTPLRKECLRRIEAAEFLSY